MSFSSYMLRTLMGKGDAKRDANLTSPQDVHRCDNIPYIEDGNTYHLLDVYYPKETAEKLPVIVSIHGGGYVYGTKEVYQYYGMFLAQQGFTVVNFNYTLAPDAHFPTQLSETCAVLQWMTKNEDTYHMDLNNVFIVGDSAGAQMASQFTAIYSNPQYAKLFDFQIPSEIHIRAQALNCGMYDPSFQTIRDEKGKLSKGNSLYKDYLGKDMDAFEAQLEVLDAITSAYPPAFIMTSFYDFLKANAKPMQELLESRGAEAEYHHYGEEGQKHMGHVFHCNMNLEEARECNRQECDFFRKHLVK